MTALIIIACGVQIVFSVIVMFFLTQVRGLTPRWPWRHPYHRILEKLIRAGICFAWLGYMFGIVYLGAAFWLGEVETIAFNSIGNFGVKGLLIALTFGAVILGHMAWLAWRADLRRNLT